MIIAKTRAELAAALDQLHGTKALVMTMGALHEGHLSLVQAAQAAADHVVVSIYVNPLQFAPNEDFEAYPRDLEKDVAALASVKRAGSAEPSVAVVFAPSDADIYPREPLVRINPGPVATVFEGVTRPTHFAGVLQIVHKVLNLVQPDVAFFGQKDAQQLALIRTMVADLNMPVTIQAVPIKRAPDGLALSSRNSYLSEEERAQALSLNKALHTGAEAAAQGATAEATLAAARAVLAAAPGVKLDYLALVHSDTFVPFAPGETGSGLLTVAAWVGATRLIDNWEVQIG
ncbi:MAG: pantoate--beta-alanine ligase [Arcanobacterium sp.]|nr:pantoate--beta-alanine ligase [Arcanobacterium sp.]